MQQFTFIDALDALTNITDNQTKTNPINSEAAQSLIKALKTASVNFKTLHRNLAGGNWFEIHELLGDYYDKIDEFEDIIVENLISLGVQDIKLNCDTIIDPKPFEEKEALQKAKEILDEIKLLSQKTRDEVDLPTSIAPAFDELENWIQIESDYKLKHYFN